MKYTKRLADKPSRPRIRRRRQILRRKFVTGASELLKLNVAIPARIDIPNAI
ncbi:MAG: hypothetical protein H0W45_01965 [Acidobacteria bacterium]|nr:hypothetical protein [Acidobacteriota bacterium]